MARSLEFWGFVLSNILLLLVGGALVVISFLAYRRNRTRSLFAAFVGFSLITAGLLVEAVYELGFEHPRFLSGVEILQLQSIEKVVIVAGFCVLLYSLLR